MEAEQDTGIVDENHALLMGNVVGVLMAHLQATSSVPTIVEPMRDKYGNYTNEINVARPSGTYTITVTKD